MKTSMQIALWAALLLTGAAAGARAGDAQVPPAQPAASAPEPGDKDESKLFREERKAEREAFRLKQQEARKAFSETLKGKKPEEQRALRDGFRAKQKDERAAFHKEQMEKRKAFRKAHPDAGRPHRGRRKGASKGE
ncbi:MAG: hypothetical protein HY926_16210 [Elusimicrobia bacterium]|nr:hypothetical protein [Elusimicrobiota bacterium]